MIKMISRETRSDFLSGNTEVWTIHRLQCESCGFWIELEGPDVLSDEEMIEKAGFFSEDLCQVCHEGTVVPEGSHAD